MEFLHIHLYIIHLIHYLIKLNLSMQLSTEYVAINIVIVITCNNSLHMYYIIYIAYLLYIFYLFYDKWMINKENMMNT